MMSIDFCKFLHGTILESDFDYTSRKVYLVVQCGDLDQLMAVKGYFNLNRDKNIEVKMILRKDVFVQLVTLPPVKKAIESLETNKIKYELFDKVRIEPTDSR